VRIFDRWRWNAHRRVGATENTALKSKFAHSIVFNIFADIVGQYKKTTKPLQTEKASSMLYFQISWYEKDKFHKSIYPTPIGLEKRHPVNKKICIK
jgi:hypothetical protein